VQKDGVDNKDSLQGISPCDTSINQNEIVVGDEAVLVKLLAAVKLGCIRGGAKVEVKPCRCQKYRRIARSTSFGEEEDRQRVVILCKDDDELPGWIRRVNKVWPGVSPCKPAWINKDKVLGGTWKKLQQV